MAIEVGALALAIEADYQRTLRQLREVDRKAADTAARQAANNDRVASSIARVETARNRLIDAQERERLAQERLNKARSDPKMSPAGFEAADQSFERARRNRENAERALANAERGRRGAGIRRAVDERKAMQAATDATEKRAQAEIEIDRKRGQLQERAIAKANQENAAAHMAERRQREAALAQEGSYRARMNRAHGEALAEDAKRTRESVALQNKTNQDYQLAKRRESDATAAAQAGHIARVQRAERQAYAEEGVRLRNRNSLHSQAIAEDVVRTNRRQSLERQAYAEDARRTRARERDAERVRRREAAADERRRRQNTRAGSVGLGLGTALGLSGAFVAATTIRSLVATTNEYQNLQQRLSTVAKSQEHANFLFAKAGEVADATRTPLASTVELYTKLRAANERLGLSERDTMIMTGAFSNSLRASGATGQAAASAMLQFGQAMSKGKLDGDEFRTVAETNSVAMRILAKDLGVTQGELLKMREEGKLTAEAVSRALIKNAKELETLANKMPMTLDQGVTSFRNSVLKMLGNSTDVISAANNVARAITGIGKALEENGPVILGLGSLALKLGAVLIAMRAISGLALTGGFAKFLTALGGPAGVVAGVGVLLQDRFAKNEAAPEKAARKMLDDAKDDEALQIALLAYSKRVNKIMAEVAAEEAKQAAHRKKQAEVGTPAFMRGDDPSIAERIKKLKAEQAYLVELIGRTGDKRAAIAGYDDPAPKVDPPGDGKDKKKKKEVDEIKVYLDQLVELHDAQAMRLEDARRAIGILNTEEAALADPTTSLERYAEALERIEKLRKLGFMTSRDVVTNREADPRDFVRDENGKVIKDKGKPLALDTKDNNKPIDLDYAQIPDEWASASHWDRWYIEQMEAMRPVANNLGAAFGETLGGALSLGIKAAFQRDAEWMDGIRGFNRTVREGLSTSLADVGAMITSFGGKLVLKGLGKTFKKIGAALGIFGKLMTKFSKFAAAHPLAAGAIAIGVGAAISALAGRIGGAVSGEDGDIAGTSGNLGINAPGPTPLVYTFRGDTPATPARNGEATTPPPADNFNFTVIGERDVTAQRQIMGLINNAKRRGL